jgi:hypothetical protein
VYLRSISKDMRLVYSFDNNSVFIELFYSFDNNSIFIEDVFQ